MKFPKMNRSRLTTVTVPRLDGGINLQDSPSMCNDNQLTNVENMWYHDGCLRTRPGIGYKDMVSTNKAEEICGGKIPLNDQTLLSYTYGIGGGNVLFGASTVSTADSERSIRKNSNIFAPGIKEDELNGELFTAFGLENKDGLICYLSTGDIIFTERDGTYEDKDYGYGDWSKTTATVPLVMLNGYGVGAEAGDNDDANVAYEDYNMLTRAFTCQFTTDGKCSKWKLPMEGLGVSKDGVSWAHIQVMLQDGTSFEETIEVSEFDGEDTDTVYHQCKNAPSTMSFTLHLDSGLLEVYSDDDGDGMSYPYAFPAIGANNNLTITVWRGAEWEKERLEVCRMTRCTWYGGTRSGLDAGTRLFVTGNPDKPNLIRWSAANDPLFFPEHNYARIGDDSQAVTGFGKMGELLVIFKEREIYATQYVAGEDDDYAYAKASGVPIDTYTAKFPVTPISHHIGCDCPDSIRLVNNRLVWLNGDGRVYMLTSPNQYSELCVREISPNIRPALLAHTKAELQAAVAGELDGYYLLLVGKKIYLLDTQNSAFGSFGYYSDEEKAKRALPWYVWRLREEYNYTGMLADGKTLWLTASKEGKDENTDRVTQHQLMEMALNCVDTVKYSMYDGKGEEENDYTLTFPIPSSFTTKLFDFGCPDVRKAVEQLYIDVADIPGGEIAVSYVTERGVQEDAQLIRTRGEATEREPGYMRTVRLTPGVHRARLFGLRLTAEGSMAVENILIKMRRQGVVR